MRLTALNDPSAGGNSPNVYLADRYHFVVQGVRAHDCEVRVEADEIANTIPALLAVDAVRRLAGSVRMDDLSLMLEVFSDSAFRIEVRNVYLVEEEAEAFERFRTTGNSAAPSMDAWRRLVVGHVTNGHTMRRVHLVRLPLSDYLRWEFTVQLGSVDAGEEIRIIDLGEHPELADIDEDAWLLDDRVAIRMVYGSDGRLLRPERARAEDLERYRGWRDRSWEAALPLTEFMAGV